MSRRCVCRTCFYRGHIDPTCPDCGGWGTKALFTLQEFRERECDIASAPRSETGT